MHSIKEYEYRALQFPGSAPRRGLFHVFDCSYTEWLDTLREAYSQNYAFRGNFRDEFSPHGFSDVNTRTGPQTTCEEFLQSGVFASAHETFKTSEARLEADRFQPGAQRPMVAGGAWIVPLVLAGNPLPARIRERTKLPPKNLRVFLNTSGGVSATAISAVTARIARGAWDYIQAGGAVTITFITAHQFTRPAADKTVGCSMRLRIPLTNASALASALSVQQYRACSMQFAKTLSPLRDDSFPRMRLEEPGLVFLDGTPKGMQAALEALRIK